MTPEQLQDIKNIFFQYASLWKKFDIQSPYFANPSDGFTIFMTHKNIESLKQFGEAVIWPLDLNQYRSSDSQTPLDERMTLSHRSDNVDKEALKKALEEFSQKINTPQKISSDQFDTIEQLFRINSGAYTVTKVDNQKDKMHIKFDAQRGIEAFKTTVANNWDIATYQYDGNEVTMTMSHSDGLHQFDEDSLIDQLTAMNQNIAITRTEIGAIQNTFTRRLTEMNIPVQSTITSESNTLHMPIYFNSQLELDSFQQNVLVHLGCKAQINPDNRLEMKLTINRYEDALTEKNLAVLFDNMQTPFLILDTGDNRGVKGSIQKNLKDLAPAIIDSVINGLAQKSTQYPLAVINEDPNGRYVSFIVASDSRERELFNGFASIFPNLCNKNKINKEQGRENFSAIVELPNNLIKYKFYIDPEKLHNMLMQESSFYRGYRQGEHSIMHLANPHTTYLKANNILCLFPVLPLTENNILIRNAGCNFSETISTQFSELAQACLPDVCGNASIYGHHNSPVMAKLQIDSQMIIRASLLCAGVNANTARIYGSHEAQDGTFNVQLTKSHHLYLKVMDDKSKEIYSLSSVTPDELNNLQSFEVPMTVFLEKIIVLLKEKAALLTAKEKPLINQSVQNIQKMIDTIKIDEKKSLSSKNRTGGILDKARDIRRYFKSKIKATTLDANPPIESTMPEKPRFDK